LKRERWGSPLVQEKYREEKACDKGHPYRIIMMMMMMMMIMIIIIIIIKNGLVHMGHRCKNNIKMYPPKMEMGVQTEFIRFRMGITKAIFEHDSLPTYINYGEINSQAE